MKKSLSYLPLPLVFAVAALAAAPASANHGKGGYQSSSPHHGAYYKSGKRACHGPMKKYRHGGWSYKCGMVPRYGAPMYQQHPGYAAAMPQPYTQSQPVQAYKAPADRAPNQAAMASAPSPEKASTIVETAVEAGTFSTLISAVKAADLVATLEGEGPFTVFAPTDEAFGKLPAGLVDALLLFAWAYGGGFDPRLILATGMIGVEMALLVAFATHPQRVLSRDQLLDLAKGRAAVPFDRSVDGIVAKFDAAASSANSSVPTARCPSSRFGRPR